MEGGWYMMGQPAQAEPGGATAHRSYRLGWPKSSPVSITATLTPDPVYPNCHASYALCSRATAQLVGDTLGPEPPMRSMLGIGLCPARMRSMTRWRLRRSSSNIGVPGSAAVATPGRARWRTYGSAARSARDETGTRTVRLVGARRAPQGPAVPADSVARTAPSRARARDNAGTSSV